MRATTTDTHGERSRSVDTLLGTAQVARRGTRVRKPKRAIVGSLVVASLLAGGCRDTDAVPENVIAAYVVLGPSASGGAQAHARVIVPPTTQTCPELEGAHSKRSMALRDNPHGFAVRVCEARIPLDQSFVVTWNRQRLPTAASDVEHILLFGDTGCDARDCPGDRPARPFDDLAADAAAIVPTPQLVVHAGDYNYRGTPGHVDVGEARRPVYDAGDDSASPECQLDQPYVSMNAGYSDTPDSWEKWRVDFFEPARPLLEIAPFVLARGNHELCSRGGPGWFYFLDASANGEGGRQLSCPPQGGATPPTDSVLSHLVFTRPRVLELGRLRIAVLDSANACDRNAPTTSVEIYRDQLSRLFAELEGDTPTWILSHRPFWGLEGVDGPTPETISQTLQAALAAAAPPAAAFPSSVRLLVSGHMHLFQSLSFDSPPAGPRRPDQIVVGNGGVKTASVPRSGTVRIRIDGLETEVLTSGKHGFTTIPFLSTDGFWQGSVVNPHRDELLANCSQPPRNGQLCVEP